MSQTVDNRVVEMRWESDQFEKGVAQSMSTLDKLKESLKFKDSSKGLEELNKNIQNVNVKSLSDGVHEAIKSFSILDGIAIQTIRKITDKVSDMGLRMAKSLSIDQIAGGFSKYEGELRSVQMIMNATGKSIQYVEGELEKLMWYTDETSYEYSNMVSNIGKFTAQGIHLDTANRAMQGIANMAGLAGASIEDASHAMDGFAKAMAKGKMDRQNWKWIQTAHMETMATKEAFIEAAIEMGNFQKVGDKAFKTTKGNIVDATTFLETLKDGWLTQDIMLKTFERFSEYSDLVHNFQEFYEELGRGSIQASDAMEMLSRDFADNVEVQETYAAALEATTGEVISLEEAHERLANWTETEAEKAFRASQEYRTFGDAIDAVKDAATSGWKDIFKNIFGNAEESKQLWTMLGNTLYDVFVEPLNSINDILDHWNSHEGFQTILDTAANLFEALGSVLGPVREAFASLFEEIDGDTIKDFTGGVARLLDVLTLSEEASENLAKGLTFLLSPLKFVAKVIGTIVKGIVFLAIVIKIAIERLLELSWSVDNIKEVFKELIGEDTFNRLKESFTMLADRIKTAFSKMREAFKSVDGKGTLLKALSIIIRGLALAVSILAEVVARVLIKAFDLLNGVTFAPFISKISSFVSKAQEKLVGFWNLMKNFFGGGANSIKEFFSSLNIGNIATSAWEKLKSLFDFLKSIFTTLSSPEVEKGAEVVSFELNKVSDSLGRTKEMVEETEVDLGPFIEKFKEFANDVLPYMVENFKEFLRTLDVGKILLMVFTGTVLKLISSISRVLNSAANVFSNFGEGVEKLMKAVTAVPASIAGFFNGLTTTLKDFTKGFVQAKKMFYTAKILLGIAAAILSLAAATWVLSKIPKDDLIKAGIALGALVLGIGLLAGVLAALQKAEKLALKSTAISLVAIAGAIVLMSGALVALSFVPWQRLLKGGGAIAGLMLIFFAFGKLMDKVKGISKGLAKFGATMILLAIAVKLLVVPIALLGTLSLKTIAKGVGAIAGIVAIFGLFGVLMAKFFNFSNNLTKFCASLLLLDVAIGLLIAPILILGGVSALSPAIVLAGIGMVALITALFGVFGFLVGKFVTIKKGLVSFAGAMALFAVAVNLLIIPILMLGVIPNGIILKGILIVTALISMLVGMGALIAAGQELKGALKSFGLCMVEFAVAVGLLLVPILLLGLLPLRIVIQGGVITAGFIVLFSLMARLIAKAGDMSQNLAKFGRCCLMIAASVAIIATLVVILSLIPDVDQAVSIAWSLAAIMGAMALLTVAVSKMDIKVKNVLLLVAMIASLLILIPVLNALSGLEWETLGKLGALLAGLFVIFGVAGIGPVAASIAMGAGAFLLMAASLVVLGGALWVIGQSITLFVSMMAALSELGPAATTATDSLVYMVAQLLSLLPLLGTMIGEAIVNLATAILSASQTIIAAISTIVTGIITAIAENVPVLVNLFVSTLTAICQAIMINAPMIVATVIVIVDMLLNALTTKVPELIDFIFQVLNQILEALVSFVPNLVMAGIMIIVGFVEGIGAGAVLIVRAAAEALLTFLNGLADAIREYAPKFREAGRNIIGAIKDAILEGSVVGQLFNAGITSIGSFVRGIFEGQPMVQAAGAGTADSLLEGTMGIYDNMYASGADGVAGFLNGVGDGMDPINGMGDAMGQELQNGVDSNLAISSPSFEMWLKGKMANLGFGGGVTDNLDILESAADAGSGSFLSQFAGKVIPGMGSIGQDALAAFNKVFGGGIDKSVYDVYDVIDGQIVKLGQQEVEEPEEPEIPKDYGSGGGGGGSGKGGGSSKETEKKEKTIKELVETYKFGEGVVEQFNKQYANSIQLFESQTGVSDIARKSVDELALRLYKASDQYQQDLTKSDLKTEEVMEHIKKSFEDQVSSIKQSIASVDIWSEFKEAEDPVSADDLITNMTDWNDAIEDWQAELQQLLADGNITDSMKQWLVNLGFEGRDKVHALAEATEDEVEEFANQFERFTELQNSVPNNVMATWSASMSGIQNIVQDGAQGIIETLNTNIAEGLDLTTAVGKAMAGAQDIFSIYKEELANGSEDVPEYAEPIGLNICEGIQQGIEEGRSDVINAVIDMVAEAIEAGEEEAEIESPSKVFAWMGRMMDEGLVQGIYKYQDKVALAGSDMVGSAIRSVQDSVGFLSNIINDEFSDPVIRPILDLSDVQIKAGQLNKLLEDNKITADAEIQNGGEMDEESGGPKYQFIQNNYSPKALSRIDIYRQTRNQFSMMKEATRK